jgi:hypothetical protein
MLFSARVTGERVMHWSVTEAIGSFANLGGRADNKVPEVFRLLSKAKTGGFVGLDGL